MGDEVDFTDGLVVVADDRWGGSSCSPWEACQLWKARLTYSSRSLLTSVARLLTGFGAGVFEHGFDDAVGPVAVVMDFGDVHLEGVDDVFEVFVGLDVALLNPLFELFHQVLGKAGEVVDEVEGVFDFVCDAGGELSE